MSSSSAVSDPGIPIAQRVCTRIPLNRVTTPQYFNEFLDRGIWCNALVRSVVVIYGHCAICLRMPSTFGIKEGCVFACLPTSAKAVNVGKYPLAFFFLQGMIHLDTPW